MRLGILNKRLPGGFAFLLLSFSCSVAFFCSCKFNPNIQGEGEDYLQGVWTEDMFDLKQQMLKYTRHEFMFTCDSVYIKLDTHSKVRNVIDSCYNDGNWQEYAKGLYVVRGDSLYIEADYTFENGKQKLSGCHGSGQYLASFKLASYNADSLVLQYPYNQMIIKLKKEKEITCVPKGT